MVTRFRAELWALKVLPSFPACCTHRPGITQLLQQREHLTSPSSRALELHKTAALPSEMWKGITEVGSRRCWKCKEIGQKRIGSGLEGYSSYFLVPWVSWALQFNLSKCFIWHCWLFSSSPGTGTNIYISLILVAEFKSFSYWILRSWAFALLIFYVSCLPYVFIFKNLEKTNLLAVPISLNPRILSFPFIPNSSRNLL